MELFSRGEDNLSARRKTPKSNQKGRWGSSVVVNEVKPKGQMELFSRGEDNLSTRRKTPKLNHFEKSVQNIRIEKDYNTSLHKNMLFISYFAPTSFLKLL